MSYIGNIPAEKYQTLQKQSFTTSATDTYTLSYSVTNPQDLALFINNVRQNPNDAYTVSGTTLTLSSAITSSDTMYAVFLGRAVETIAPAVGSVTNDMISYPLAKSGATVSTFNRTTSDGTILDFQKDGTSAGTLKTVSGVTLALDASGSFVGFQLGGTGIVPRKSGTLSTDVDLGTTSYPFDNVFVGSNIYLGGTGSANALYDYEEGTWTPTFGGASTDPSSVSWNNQSGTYTKVGNKVFVRCIVYPSSFSGGSGNFNVRGLPFTPNAQCGGTCFYDRIRVQASYPVGLIPFIENNTTYFQFAEVQDASDEGLAILQVDDLASNFYLNVCMTYTTNS